MTTASLTLALVLVLAGFAGSQFPSPTLPEKPDRGPPPPEGILQGADTIETAVPIDGLPYYTTGTTEGFNDDYDEVCSYSGSTAPDVVYSWVADFTGFVDIHTCESSYDTKLCVYQDVWTPGSYHACNDDNSDCPGPIYRSWIESMPVTAGKTYYVVVDG
jgi:hypothetical protein